MQTITQNARAAVPTMVPGSKLDGKPTIEERQAPRKPTRLPAIVKLEEVHDELACVVTDISATGARIKLTEYDRIPFTGRASSMGDVTLYMTRDRIVVVCEAIWRNKSELGLKFLTTMQHYGE